LKKQSQTLSRPRLILSLIQMKAIRLMIPIRGIRQRQNQTQNRRIRQNRPGRMGLMLAELLKE
jgi:hypothetical protein